MASLSLQSVVDLLAVDRSLIQQAARLVDELVAEDEIEVRRGKLRNVAYLAGLIAPSQRGALADPQRIDPDQLVALIDWVTPRVLAVFLGAPAQSDERARLLYEHYSYYRSLDKKIVFIACVLHFLRYEHVRTIAAQPEAQ